MFLAMAPAEVPAMDLMPEFAWALVMAPLSFPGDGSDEGTCDGFLRWLLRRCCDGLDA